MYCVQLSRERVRLKGTKRAPRVCYIAERRRHSARRILYCSGADFQADGACDWYSVNFGDEVALG